MTSNGKRPSAFHILISLFVLLAAAAGTARAGSNATVPWPASDTDAQTSCSSVSVPVTLGLARGAIAGTLCVPAGATTIQLLVHGATYARYYWDLPYGNDQYSYVRKANKAGYATLAVDRLGSGASWHPLATQVTYPSNAEVLSQVVQALRNGKLGPSFKKVIYVGHSFGSAVGLLVAGKCPGIDALILTGFSHRLNLVALALKLEANFIPTQLDPKFQGKGYVGYLTTRAGTRRNFYTEDQTDPTVIALDEVLKQTATLPEGLFQVFVTLQFLSTSASHRINVPVLVLNGTEDPFFCGLPLGADCASNAALADFERPFFGSGAIVEGALFSGIGHNPTLQYSAPAVANTMLDFVNRYIGP